MSWCRTTPTCCERWACSHPPGTGTRPGRLLSVRCRPQNAEVTKQVTVARQAQGDVEREKKELEDSFQRVSEQSQRKVSRVHGGDGDGDPCLHSEGRGLGRGWVPHKDWLRVTSLLPTVPGAGRGARDFEAGAGSQQAGAAGLAGNTGDHYTGERPLAPLSAPCCSLRAQTFTQAQMGLGIHFHPLKPRGRFAFSSSLSALARQGIAHQGAIGLTSSSVPLSFPDWGGFHDHIVRLTPMGVRLYPHSLRQRGLMGQRG